jgi:predicted nucleic acid-binding protein
LGVVTRPVAYNGLGLTTVAALAELERLKNIFLLLPETPAIFPAWDALVGRYQVSGKPTHDARLVAVMQVHGLTSILTFNPSDFRLCW